MNCRAAHDLLQQRLDGTPIESPEWFEHLRLCSDCRNLEDAARRLQHGLRLLASPPPPPHLAVQIAERVVLDRRRARRKARRRWAVTFALAASLFLALALRLDWRGHLGTETREDEARNASGLRPSPLLKSPTLRESVTQASEAVAALTSQAADETVAPTRWLTPSASSPSLPKVDLPDWEPAARPLRQAGEGVSAGLEPVTNSARRAVGLFLRELPPMETGEKGL